MSGKKVKVAPPRVGDIVRIDLRYPRSMKDGSPFNAKVTKIWQQDDNIISYERLDGVFDKFPTCNILYITEFVERAPYLCTPEPRENIYKAHERGYSVRIGGRRMSWFQELVKEALAGVDHIDLRYPLHIERATRLYHAAACPGKVEPTDVHQMHPAQIEVRWKTFSRWVRRNAQRLIESKSEALGLRKANKKRQDDDLRSTIEADMDFMEAEFERNREERESMLDDEQTMYADAYDAPIRHTRPNIDRDHLHAHESDALTQYRG